jgi:hypothetical protein
MLASNCKGFATWGVASGGSYDDLLWNNDNGIVEKPALNGVRDVLKKSAAGTLA